MLSPWSEMFDQVCQNCDLTHRQKKGNTVTHLLKDDFTKFLVKTERVWNQFVTTLNSINNRKAKGNKTESKWREQK